MGESVLILPPVSEPVFQMSALSSPPPPAPAEPVAVKSADVDALEDRLRRLEAVLSRLAEPQRLEEQVAARKRVEQAAPVATAAATPVATPAAPVAIPAVAVDQPQQSASVAGGRRWLPFTLGARVASAAAADDSRPGVRARWLFLDILRELQSILHMYGDPRYRLTWSGRILPVAFVALIATSGFWTYPLTGWMPALLGNLMLKTIDLVPAFCLFRVLTREAQRYRETVPQYPPSSNFS
jgi:hypothetical protein